MKVKGRTNIPLKGGFILASNHTSNLDPMILGVASTRELNFMAKEGLFKNSLIANFLFSVGAFPIKRDSGDVRAIKQAINRLKRGSALVVFPEGTRNKNNPEVQSGIGMLASRANCPILPAFISGAGKAMPRGSRFIRPTKITVRFGKLLNFERNQAYGQIANQVMKEILSLQ